MPTRPTTRKELQQVFNAVKDARLLDMPGPHLLSHLEILARGVLPPGLAAGVLPRMDDNQRCLQLAIALAMTRPQGLSNPHQACIEFHQIANDLLAAWGAARHKDAEKMRKTVDHVIVFGARHAWPGASEVIYYLILGDPARRRPFHQDALVPGWLPHDPPLPRPLPVGGIEASISFLEGLIPDLDTCWGEPIGSQANVHAAYIQNRLFQPMQVHHLSLGEMIGFNSDREGLHFSVRGMFRDVPPGSSRTFMLFSGNGALVGPGFNHHVPARQRLIVRALDEGDADIQLAHLVPNPQGGAIAGPTCKLHDGQAAALVAGAESQLEDWSCTCGKMQCDKRHRLDGWDLRTVPPNGSLRTFILTAVKGPQRGFKFKSFITGMYYALLCDGV